MNPSFFRTAMICILFLGAIPEASIANDPAQNTPWPVGFNTTEMEEISRTLMHSYGDLNGGWSLSVFHAGIDIHESTGSPPCNEVRCVDNGYATVIDEIPTKGSDGATQWVVIICDGIGGSVQNGWSYGHITEPSFAEEDTVAYGQLVGFMTDSIEFPHVHFMWCDWFGNPFSYCNPLKYLSPSPTFEDGYNWTFNPEEKDPSFEHFFLPDTNYTAWSDLTVQEAQNQMLDPASLSGDVDFFFGVSLRGDGNTGGTGAGNMALAPQKISWDVVRELASGEETLATRHVFDFDCVLKSSVDSLTQMLYFRYPMISLFNNNDALSFCLTNCDIAAEWDGINTINERSWNTDALAVNVLSSTENPILGRYPDGPYRLDVLCYAFDEDCDFPTSIDDVELHNFAPALQSVSIIDLETDQTYYSGVWEPNGTSAELAASSTPAPAGAELQVILLFTEEMETSVPSVTLGPLSTSNGEWSNSIVPNDTWTGEVTLPVGLTDGVYTLLVRASDTDNNNLMNPEGEGTVPGPAYDCHHALNLQFAAGVEWTRSLHDDVHGSPKLADFDDDGDLEIALISVDGWGDLLGDDGYSLAGWPVDNGFSPTDPVVTASPGIADFIGSSVPEIIFMSEVGNYIRYANGIFAFPASWFRWCVNCSPVIGDFDGDSQNEFMIGRQYKINSGNYFTLTARDTDGSWMWHDDDLGPNSSITATPSVCNLDNMGGLEVVAVTDATEYSQTDACGTVYCYSASNGADKWNTSVGGNIITSAVVTANTDDDPVIEVIVAGVSTGGNQVKILRGDTGFLEATFTVSGSVDAGVSIADINQNGRNDIVLSSSGNGGMLYCWTWNGFAYVDALGFPVNLGTWTDDGVSIADIDSDSQLELVIAGKDGNLHVINHDGTVTSGFPLAISGGNSLSGQPAIGDIDSDGRLEIVFFELNASVIHCVELGDNTANNYLPWPQFQHDAQNTGYFPTDGTAPAEPTCFGGNGGLSGNIFTANLSWTLSINDPTLPTPTAPADVVSYRIYRKIPGRDPELVATLPAGTSSYTDVVAFSAFPCPPAVAYFASAWDGVNESVYTPVLKVLTGSLKAISTDCPVREIGNSEAIRTSQSIASTQIGTDSSIPDTQRRSDCRILTDGNYDAVYFPSGNSDCIEIDLGATFTISEVFVTRSDESLIESCRYEVSTDGRSFSSSADSNRARYVRVYGAAGATEVEVYGTTYASSTSPVEVQRNSSEGYSITVTEEGSPVTATVFDLSGRNVWQNTSSTGEILWNKCTSSGNTVPNGVYLIMVESDDIETFTSKIVVR